MEHGKQQQVLGKLKSARLSSGLTQAELATKTGIPRTTISKIEAGFRNTTLQTFFSLAQAVNLDFELVKKKIATTAKILQKSFTTLNQVLIDQNNLLFNYDFFAKKFTKSEIWPVIKANAYGHGIAPIIKILEERRPTYVIADSYFEALEVWAVNPRQNVLIIGTVLPENFSQIDLGRATLVISDLISLRALGKSGQKAKIHLEINTGLNRGGLKLEQITKFCQILADFPQLELEGVMSHLADADNPNTSFTKAQEEKFARGIKIIEKLGFKPKYFHLDATAGSVTTSHKYNAIRLGIGLYGYNHLPPTHPGHKTLEVLRPCLTLTASIVNLIRLEPGDHVSYGGNFVATKPTTIGTISVGYYDGLDRSLSGRASIGYRGKTFPVVGTICMNLCMVDFGDETTHLHETVTVIDQNKKAPNSVAGLSQLSHLVLYETLVRINQTTRRMIV